MTPMVVAASEEPLTPVIFVLVIVMVLLKYTFALAARTKPLPGARWVHRVLHRGRRYGG